MKKNVFMVGMAVMVLTFGTMVTGCASNPSSNSGNKAEPVNMAGTTWVWSSGNDSSTYTFIDSTTYKVGYTGTFLIQYGFLTVFSMAGGVEADKIGTGTYSVTNQTVTLRPAGGVYLEVSSDGKINMQTKNESFTITVANDSFKLGAITYRKTNQ